MLDISLLTDAIINKKNIDAENIPRIDLNEKFLIKNINILIDDYNLIKENSKSVETLVGLLQDTSNKLEQKAKDFDFLLNIAKKSINVMSLEALFDSLLEIIIFETESHFAAFVLDNSDLHSGKTIHVKNTLGRSGVINHLFPAWEDIRELALKNMKTVFIHNTQEHPVFENLDLLPFSFICLPLYYGKEILGVLNLGHKEPDHYPDDILKNLEIISSLISVILKNRMVLSQYRLPPSAITEALFNTSWDCVFILDASCRILLANRHAGELLGKFGLEGMSFLSFLSNDIDRNNFLSLIEDLLKSNTVSDNVRYEIKNSKKGSKTLDMSISIIKKINKTIEAIVICGKSKI